MEFFVVSSLIFGSGVMALVAGQWLRGTAMPAGCRPVNGKCCLEPCSDNSRASAPDRMAATGSVAAQGD